MRIHNVLAKISSLLYASGLRFGLEYGYNRRLSTMSISNLRTLESFGTTKDNSIFDNLIMIDVPQFTPAQITNAHFVCVEPEKVSSPYLVIASSSCAHAVGLDSAEIEKKTFAETFSGNELVEGLDNPYATVYGCHCYGNWFGQLGDGRAMTLGEVASFDSNLQQQSDSYELQLKGCGRTPFSRGFDGRAVLRSSVREFLVSEAMFHLRVPTTRALSVVGTGDKVRRPWYAASVPSGPEKGPKKPLVSGPTSGRDTSRDKFSPDRMILEPGAVLCRVSRSFLRFSHLEIFSQRRDGRLLQQMADYVCLREYPHLLEVTGSERYVALFREVVAATAGLVAEWLRVGYTQGNMNSDNTLLGGRTVDYGPYGWMERYDPEYQPFTSDADGKFAFAQQPQAMAVNCLVLAESFKFLLTHVSETEPAIQPTTAATKTTTSTTQSNLPPAASVVGSEFSPNLSTVTTLQTALAEVDGIASSGFANAFWSAYNHVRQRKLGLKKRDSTDDVSSPSTTPPAPSSATDDSGVSGGGSVGISVVSDARLWADLEGLMYRSNADFTLTFRALCEVSGCADVEAAWSELSRWDVFYEPTRGLGVEGEEENWKLWLGQYLTRIQEDNRPAKERKREQLAANPTYVLRNWMAARAYESAASGDYSVVKELEELLRTPYADQSPRAQNMWARRAPLWALSMPGVAFLS